jgi:hypothetical protein
MNKAMLAVASVVMTMLGSASVASPATPGPIVPDGYFLSAINPVATSDQRDIEALALRLMDSREVKAGREKTVFRWKVAVRNDPSPEAWAMFDAAMEEYAFNFVMKAANSDPNYPRVAQLWMQPHEWLGMKVPGSRMGGDNPDNSYRIIPIDGNAHYEISGRRFANPPSDVTFTLVGNYNTSKTLGSLEGRDLQVAADGTFTIQIGPEPANGRTNYIQGKPNAVFLFIRDSRGDWRQLPNALRVKRLDPPSAPPLSEQQLAARAAEIMFDEVPLTYWWMRLVGDGPQNVASRPERPSVAAGGLVSQVSSDAGLTLREDEAAVITENPAGAAFRNIVLQDFWFRTLDYPRHTSSFNNTQAVPNTDGTVTYVAAIKDPGVHNWLDMAGLHRVRMNHRWQGLPRGKSDAGEPALSIQVVKLKDLRKVLPKGTKWVTQAERKQQLAKRLASYEFRMVDR